MPKKNEKLEGIVTLDSPSAPEETPLDISDLRWLIDQNLPHFEEMWNDGEINERMYIAKNWVDEQEANIRAQGRVPYSFPLVASKHRQIEGLQTQLRTSFQVDPVTKRENEIKADIAEVVLRTAESRSKFKYIESEVFKSGSAAKYGVAKVEIENDGVENRMNFKKVDYKNFIWDLSDYTFELEDPLFVAEVEQRKIFEMEAEGYDVKNWRADNNSMFGRDLERFTDYYGTSDDGQKDMNIIRIFNAYVKTNRTYYTVVVEDKDLIVRESGLTPPMLGSFTDKKDAEKLLRQVRTAQILAGVEPEGYILEHEKEVYDFYRFNYFEILEYEELDIDTHPYSVYFAIKFEDKFISFYDFLKSPQIFYDRMFMQIDYSIGKDVKSAKQLWVDGLDDRETPQSAKRKLDETGETIFTKTPAAVVQSIQTQGAKTEWLQINNIMTQIIEDVAGGAAFFGLSEGNESGKAILAKQRLGQTMAQTLFDNLLRWKENLGVKALKYHAHYINNEQTLRVNGDHISKTGKKLLMDEGLFIPSRKTHSSGYLTVNKKGYPQSFLDDEDLEVSITTAPLTENEKEARYNNMVLAEQNDPLLAQSLVWQEIKIENLPQLTSDQRERLLEERAQIIQAQQQAAQREEERKDMDLRLKAIKTINDANNKSAGTAIKKQEADQSAQQEKAGTGVSILEASRQAG